jgi:hypothetical protein
MLVDVFFVFYMFLARGVNSYRRQYRPQYEDSNFKIYRPGEAQGNIYYD